MVLGWAPHDGQRHLIDRKLEAAGTTVEGAAATLLGLVLDQTASLMGAVGVESDLTLFHVADDAFLVDHKRGSVREPVFLVENTVGLRDRPLKVTEEGKIDAFLFRESIVGRRTVHADPQYLRPSLLEFGDISLIRLQLLRSTPGKGQNVERQHDILFSQKITQLHLVSVLIRQDEVGRLVAHF